MKLSFYLNLFLVVVGFMMFSCGQQRKAAAPIDQTGEMLTNWMPSAPVVIYKTRSDYSDLVPVILNDDRTRIVSYPDPQDLQWNGTLMLPVLLAKGYLLDNRGINEHVAFLNMTYKEYSQLKQPPHLVELMLRIRDRQPLTEMYRCGFRSDYSDLIYELNVLIDRGLVNCEKLTVVPMSVELKTKKTE